jgi:hypothetical protein
VNLVMTTQRDLHPGIKRNFNIVVQFQISSHAHTTTTTICGQKNDVCAHHWVGLRKDFFVGFLQRTLLHNVVVVALHVYYCDVVPDFYFRFLIKNRSMVRQIQDLSSKTRYYAKAPGNMPARILIKPRQLNLFAVSLCSQK